MIELYRTLKRARLDATREVPFQDESDLQRLILKHPEILGKAVKVVASKYKLVGHGGEIDVLAVDRSSEDTKLLVVEVKRDGDSKVLGQLLDYADWVISNPTIVRMETRQKTGVDLPESEIQRPTLIVVASCIQDRLANLARYIHGFDWDIVEVHQFATGRQLFAVVRHVLPVEETLKDPCWELYRVRGYAEEQINFGKKLLADVKEFAEVRKWKLDGPMQLLDRSSYGEWVFKTGNKWVFGIGPEFETHGWYLWFELPKEPRSTRFGKVVERGTWYEPWFYIDVPTRDFDSTEFERLFVTAYTYAVRRK